MFSDSRKHRVFHFFQNVLCTTFYKPHIFFFPLLIMPRFVFFCKVKSVHHTLKFVVVLRLNKKQLKMKVFAHLRMLLACKERSFWKPLLDDTPLCQFCCTRLILQSLDSASPRQSTGRGWGLLICCQPAPLCVLYADVTKNKKFKIVASSFLGTTPDVCVWSEL